MKGNYVKQFDEDTGDLFKVEEFKEMVKNGFLIDDDGVGNPVQGIWIDPTISIQPSALDEIPEDADHILWYNK